jgi:hypothetical protein
MVNILQQRRGNQIKQSDNMTYKAIVKGVRERGVEVYLAISVLPNFSL